MSNWYEIVSSEEPLTQGDFIFDCPVPTWRHSKSEEKDSIESLNKSEIEILQEALEFISIDAVVMTQACDLEQNKVLNVTLCPHLALSEYRKDWEAYQQVRNQKTNMETWRKQCEFLKKGYVWNLTLLNNLDSPNLKFEHRVVDFYEVYTLPKKFLETLLKERKQQRPRLLPPYREHLSQSFARFYMRVGLPNEINKGW